MGFQFFMSQEIFFFARARVHAFEKLHEQIAIAIVFAISLSASLGAVDQTPPFILGQDSQIHGISLDHSQEHTTRETMGIAEDCTQIKKQATAMPLMSAEGASVDPRIHSTRGVMVLEGLIPGAEPKILDTELLSHYMNYPTSIPGERGRSPSPRCPLAITLAAKFIGSGDLVFRKGDYLIVHADGQLYAFSLPEITIPSDGLLRLYVGTDDTLYYDATLKHPFHSGACRSQQN